MQTEISLKHVQVSKLHMTPALSQAIKLLQFSSEELKDYVNERIAENPVLEFTESIPSSSPAADFVDPFQFIEADENKLEKYLREQILLLDLTVQQQQILQFLIASLEPNGLLPLDLNIAAGMLKVSKPEVDEMVQALKRLEPVGIGCNSVMDYLLFQLDEQKQNKVSESAAEILQNDLMEWSSKNYRVLIEKYGLTFQEIEEISLLYQSLQKSPIEGFEKEQTEFQAPDIIVDYKDNQYILRITDYLLPEIRIDYRYVKELFEAEPVSVKEYVQEKVSEAEFLIKSLEKRKFTLYRVAEAIINCQEEFLTTQVHYLKSLRLKDIAEKLEIHESTVSRITRNKYMQTPKGLFSFKFFFQQGIPCKDGIETESVSKVKEKIKEIIKKENRHQPFSDEKIKDLLVMEEIQISRRTIAKYRKEMNIHDSVKRKYSI